MHIHMQDVAEKESALMQANVRVQLGQQVCTMYVCIHVYPYVCVYTCVSLCMCVYMCIPMYVCIHVYPLCYQCPKY